MADEQINWVVAYTVTRDDEAIFIKGFLDQSGIDCVIENVKFHAEPVNLGEMAEIRLLVPAHEADEARRLIQEAQDNAEANAASDDGEES